MNLRDLPITLDPKAISLAEGLRAGIAVAATLLVAQIFNLPHFGLAALGALLTCFADPGGPIRRRIPAVASFAVLSGLAYGLFGLVRGEGIWLAAPIAGFAIFCACFARIYGQSGLQVGNLLTVVIVLAVDRPLHLFSAAALQGFNLCAGAAWATLLTLAIWQLHPYAPARQALAQVAARLADLARDLAALANAEPEPAGFTSHAASHRRAVREAIEAAREIAFSTFRGRGLVSRRAAQLSVRLQTLEQVFGSLIALSDTLEHDLAQRREGARVIRLIAGWLAALGPDLVADRSLDTPKKRASLERLKTEIARLPEDGEQRHVLEAIAEYLAVLITVSRPLGQALDGLGPAEPWQRRLFGPIRSNWSFSSAPMRHALRAGITATPVLAWTMGQHSLFAHWTTITLVLCLQPYFSATWVRSAERIIGTALGGLAAAGIGLIAQTRLDLALAMIPLTVFAFTVRAVNFGLFIAALTPMIVLLIEQIAPGTDEITVAISRIDYTLLGGALAVAANLLLFPAFEGGRLETSISAAIRAHGDYLRAVFSALLENGPPPDAARRAAGLASNNMEAALSRALLEPHRRRDPVIERGAVVDAALRRMAGRLAVLALDRPAVAPQDRGLWQGWADWLDATLAGEKHPRPALPAGPAAETLTRLARQAELLAA
jgi:uncharacterized membrane protein YccC